jgi:hypothetical protein
LSGAERAGLVGILWVSAAGALVAAISAGVNIFGIWLGDPALSITLGNSFFPELAGDNPRVLSGQYDTASITIADMPATARALLTAASLMRHLVFASICVAMFLLCRRVLQYRPLAKSSTNALGIVGIVVLLGAAFPSIFESLATLISAVSLGLPGPSQIDNREVVDGPALHIDFSLLALGTLMFVIATALQMGARMQLGGALPAGMPPQGPPNDGLRP